MKRYCYFLFCFLIVAISCSKDPQEKVVPISDLRLDKHELRLERGGNAVLAVTVTPSNATDKTVSWVSTDPGIATVSDGVVIAVSTGTTEIIAKSGNYYDKCVVSVVISATSVNLNASKIELFVGKTAQLSASVLPKDTTDEIEWSSSDESIATVDKGHISAISEGAATISAKVGVLIATCEVIVKSYEKPGDGLLYGTWVLDTYKIEASGTNNDGNDYTLPVPISYKLKETTLTFGEDLVAWAHMGWETKSAVYSFDNEKQQVTFGKLLEVSDDGMIMVLAGTFDVATLTEDALVLKQPYGSGNGINFGDISIPSKAVATYTYHRKK
ncbi:MAG: Ig domain-containing protein [Bacteroidales bacterium]|nr:Ig domain-containing protein [Bacteroidales bacterium]